MDAPQDRTSHHGGAPGCPLAVIVADAVAGGVSRRELTVTLPLGQVTLQVLDGGHRVTVDGRPVETLAAVDGAPLLFPSGRTHAETARLFRAAGRDWRVAAKLRSHSAVSARYVADQLRDRLPHAGVLLDRPGRDGVLTALVAGGAGWTAWHLYPSNGGRALVAQTVTSVVA